MDVWSGAVNRFVWNLEGTLARWDTPLGSSVYSYNEDGYLVRHTVGTESRVTQHNSDGVHIRETLYGNKTSLILYFVCSVGCMYPLCVMTAAERR
jgi:YD repeat-containing protein